MAELSHIDIMAATHPLHLDDAIDDASVSALTRSAVDQYADAIDYADELLQLLGGSVDAAERRWG